MIKPKLKCIRLAVGAACGTLALWGTACRCDAPDDTRDEVSPAEVQTPQVDLLVFPDELYVDDASVNDFVTRAMDACATGEYEAFRLLWTARQDPLPRDEFEKGWQAVERIHIRALEQVALASDAAGGDSETRVGYAIFAQVQLDPTRLRGQTDAHRDVVLAIVQEHGDWRLARAPKAMREWIMEKVMRGP
ncbi:MAG: hypothetical protein JSU63_13985 [Phycisphaerales bacterium]|nr:MAG: hypothetical protein JSU63_13985 [Phycisphaerales bacterium]